MTYEDAVVLCARLCERHGEGTYEVAGQEGQLTLEAPAVSGWFVRRCKPAGGKGRRAYRELERREAIARELPPEELTS